MGTTPQPSFLDTLRTAAQQAGTGLTDKLSGMYGHAKDALTNIANDTYDVSTPAIATQLVKKLQGQPNTLAAIPYKAANAFAATLGAPEEEAGEVASEVPATLKPALKPTGEIAWPDSYKNPPVGGGGNYSASDLDALKERMGLIPERRATPRTAPMSATEIETAMKSRKPIHTAFDDTVGSSQTVANDPFMPKPFSASSASQGGHAGGGVLSAEEVNRPGLNYVVGKSGVTYHGKSYAPEATPIGAAHVTVLPSGEFQVNEGNLSPTGRMMLQRAVGAR